MSLRILIVDDHAVVRAGFASLVGDEEGLEVIGEAASGEEALRLVGELKPDMILMDVELPGCSGIETTHELKARYPDVRVLILTLHDEECLLREAIQAGASAFLLKQSSEQQLFDAIHAVARGELYIDPTLIRAWLYGTAPVVRASTRGEDGLTERQIEVLQLVAEGYTNSQIAERLFVSLRTVEYHRKTLTTKLHVQSRAELVRFAVRRGLLEEPPAVTLSRLH